MLEAIVAVYADWGIGADGTQPVAVKADRKRFRELTEGAAVIVGRKTLADFPGGKPLKNRVNIVLTHGPAVAGAVTARSVAEALGEAERRGRTFVIGGERVYSGLFPHIWRVYVTKLDCKPHSDAFVPNLDADPAWRVAETGGEQEEGGIRFRFLTYERAALCAAGEKFRACGRDQAAL